MKNGPRIVVLIVLTLVLGLSGLLSAVSLVDCDLVESGRIDFVDFAFFANSRVLAVEAAPLRGHLAGKESFDLKRKR